jgi:hypothetical protein
MTAIAPAPHAGLATSGGPPTVESLVANSPRSIRPISLAAIRSMTAWSNLNGSSPNCSVGGHHHHSIDAHGGIFGCVLF